MREVFVKAHFDRVSVRLRNGVRKRCVMGVDCAVVIVGIVQHIRLMIVLQIIPPPAELISPRIFNSAILARHFRVAVADRRSGRRKHGITRAGFPRTRRNIVPGGYGDIRTVGALKRDLVCVGINGRYGYVRRNVVSFVRCSDCDCLSDNQRGRASRRDDAFVFAARYHNVGRIAHRRSALHNRLMIPRRVFDIKQNADDLFVHCAFDPDIRVKRSGGVLVFAKRHKRRKANAIRPVSRTGNGNAVRVNARRVCGKENEIAQRVIRSTEFRRRAVSGQRGRRNNVRVVVGAPVIVEERHIHENVFVDVIEADFAFKVCRHTFAVDNGRVAAAHTRPRHNEIEIVLRGFAVRANARDKPHRVIQARTLRRAAGKLHAVTLHVALQFKDIFDEGIVIVLRVAAGDGFALRPRFRFRAAEAARTPDKALTAYRVIKHDFRVVVRADCNQIRRGGKSADRLKRNGRRRRADRRR